MSYMSFVSNFTGQVKSSLDDLESDLMELEDLIEESAVQNQILDMKMTVAVRHKTRTTTCQILESG